jgi:hypothetical protein
MSRAALNTFDVAINPSRFIRLFNDFGLYIQICERGVWLGYEFRILGTLEAPTDQRESSAGTHTIPDVNPGQFGLYSSLCKSAQGPYSTQSAPVRTVALFLEPAHQPALTVTNATCGMK